MNRIELEDNGFPFSADALRFLQNAYTQAIGNICKANGENYIVWGCEVVGNTISAGAIVVDGELMPFAAGTYNAKFKVEETSTSVTYMDQVQRPAFFTKTASCSANGSYTLANFPRLAGGGFKYEPIGWTNLEWSSLMQEGQDLYDTAHNEDHNTQLAPSSDLSLKVRRNSDGEVLLRFGGGMAEDWNMETATTRVMTTLPEAFRPKSEKVVPCRYFCIGVGFWYADLTVTVKTNGEVVADSASDNNNNLIQPYGNVRFLID